MYFRHLREEKEKSNLDFQMCCVLKFENACIGMQFMLVMNLQGKSQNCVIEEKFR